MTITDWVDTAKARTRAMLDYYQGKGVSRGFWFACLCSWAVLLLTQFVLGGSLYINALFLDPNSSAVHAQMEGWRSFLAWVPLLPAYLFYAAFSLRSAAALHRDDRAHFIQCNGDTPFSHAVFKNIALKRVAFSVLRGLAAAPLLFISVAGAVLMPGKGIEFLLPLLAGAILASAVIVGLAQVQCWAAKCAWVFVKSKLPRSVLDKASGATLRQEFHRLPSTERSILAKLAMQMGADPESPAMMRAALADYRQRLAQAASQSKALDRQTPAASASTSRARL